MSDKAQSFVEIFLPDEESARQFGNRLGAWLRPGHIVLLEGPVGAGKSHIARAAIRAILGEETEVPSPTFTLVQTYETPDSEIWHADLYRLTDPAEVFELGLFDAMGRDIVLIEWPDRLGRERPNDAITISISYKDEGRILQITAADDLLDIIKT